MPTSTLTSLFNSDVIDVDVNLARVRRIGFEVAGDAIVEAHAERDQQIGVLDRVVDRGCAVHPHHAEHQADGFPACAPLPSKVRATGICACSANVLQFRLRAAPCMIPCPARISGRSAWRDQFERSLDLLARSRALADDSRAV